METLRNASAGNGSCEKNVIESAWREAKETAMLSSSLRDIHHYASLPLHLMSGRDNNEKMLNFIYEAEKSEGTKRFVENAKKQHHNLSATTSGDVLSDALKEISSNIFVGMCVEMYAKKQETGLNTRIGYGYKNELEVSGSNYSCILNGTLSEEERTRLRESLFMEEFFIPEMFSLPSLSPEIWNDMDGPWHFIDDIEDTDESTFGESPLDVHVFMETIASMDKRKWHDLEGLFLERQAKASEAALTVLRENPVTLEMIEEIVSDRRSGERTL